MAAPNPGGHSPGFPGPPQPPAVSSMQGKRKALKLNFANPPFKSTARFTLNTTAVPFQNPQMVQKQDSIRNLETSYHKPEPRMTGMKNYSTNEQATKNRLYVLIHYNKFHKIC